MINFIKRVINKQPSVYELDMTQKPYSYDWQPKPDTKLLVKAEIEITTIDDEPVYILRWWTDGYDEPYTVTANNTSRFVHPLVLQTIIDTHVITPNIEPESNE